MAEKIRVLIVDDHTVVRHGLRLMLELKPDIEIAGEAQDGFEAVQKARELNPDIILMDLEMPRMGGLQAIQEICKQQPTARILVLTSFNEDEKIISAVQAGARGYLLKDSSPGDLVQAIRDIYEGRASLSPEFTRRLLMSMHKPQGEQPPIMPLTERELEVIRLAAKGMSNPEIAAELVISEGTVRFHFSNIFGKLLVPNRTQAVLYAIREGWAELA